MGADTEIVDDLNTAVRRVSIAQRARAIEDEQRVIAAEFAATAARFSLGLRETQVLALIARGYTNTEIGDALFISQETVKSHIQHILQKMNARSRAHAVAIAVGFPLPDRPDRAIATAVATA